VWGNNSFGQLGLNLNYYSVKRSSPVQIGSATNWYVGLNSGFNNFATNSSKNLWGWGINTNGQLGQNNVINRSSPVQVGSLTNWTYKFVASLSGSFGIKSDGTLWAWGAGSSGQLGQNNLISRSSPVQVGSLTNWSYIHTAGESVMAIKTDGTLWAWGRNVYFGQLGLGDIFNRSSPVQVGTDTNWSKCRINGMISVALKTNGTLWSCGNGRYGRTGLGLAYTSTLAQIGSSTDWSAISISLDGNSNYGGFAIKTTGAMWVWGRNSFGSLGLNNLITQSTPVQLGLLTNWSKVSSGGYSTMSIKTDGTLWAIGGRNQAGQLGLNDVVNRSSPVQVGSQTTWTNISGSLQNFLATKT
jgi:alpha-tubulin suppressor-like RCC1 family protein